MPLKYLHTYYTYLLAMFTGDTTKSTLHHPRT